MRLGIPLLFGLVSRSLFAPIFRAKFGRLGLLKPGFRKECIAKNKFSQDAFFMISELTFSCLPKALEQFSGFCRLGTGLKIDGFSGGIWIQHSGSGAAAAAGPMTAEK